MMRREAAVSTKSCQREQSSKKSSHPFRRDAPSPREKRFKRKDQKDNFHFVECSYGIFGCPVRPPFPVTSEEVMASLQNGVLTVALPKAERQERPRCTRGNSHRRARRDNLPTFHATTPNLQEPLS